MDRYDLVIRNAAVIDGTRAPRYAADIAVAGGRIAAIGPLDAARADTDIDASGKVAAPGFIDSPTHDDRLMLSAPDMAAQADQGRTTLVGGHSHCPASPAANRLLK